MNRACHWLVFVLTLAAASVNGAQPLQTARNNETKEQRAARMQWWREARFGMFIHWDP